MKVLILASIFISLGTLTLAFAPNTKMAQGTKLEMATRRDAIGALILGSDAALLSWGQQASAFSQQLPDNAYEPSQQATDGKLDLNSAFVGEYKELRGMFPTAAGKIASNGPYSSVKDIYKIPGLTENDIKLFKKYEKEFTVHPPGRTFDERINGRVST